MQCGESFSEESSRIWTGRFVLERGPGSKTLQKSILDETVAWSEVSASAKYK